MRQAGFLHDVGHARPVVAAAPDRARSDFHDTFMRGFLAALGSGVVGFSAHDDHHISVLFVLHASSKKTLDDALQGLAWRQKEGCVRGSYVN
jgi:hypothetical protein